MGAEESAGEMALVWLGRRWEMGRKARGGIGGREVHVSAAGRSVGS